MGVVETNPDKVWRALVGVSEELYGVGEDILLSGSRRRFFVDIRRIMMHLYRSYTKESLPQIGERFGRDHTTVLHHLKRAEDYLSYDKVFREEYSRFKEKLMCKL